jgi:hypothetical protein
VAIEICVAVREALKNRSARADVRLGAQAY